MACRLIGRQAITQTNAAIVLIGPLGTTRLQWDFNQNANIFIHENAFENIVCEMAAILFRPQCVKKSKYHLDFFKILCTIP